MRNKFIQTLMSSIIVIGIVSVAWCQIHASNTDKNVDSNIPTADFIAAALSNQDRASGDSLTIDYKIDWKKFGSKDSIVHTVDVYHYTKTPDALYIERQREGGVTNQKSYYDRTAKAGKELVSDGKESVGAILDVEPTDFRLPETFETALYPLKEGPLCDRIKFGMIDPEMVDIDGHKCWRVEVPSDSRSISKYFVYVDPNIGFNPRRIECIMPVVKPTVIDFKDYSEVTTGFWFPKVVDLSYGNVNKPEESFRQICTLNKIVVGVKLEKTKLDIEFKSGTTVTKGAEKYVVE